MTTVGQASAWDLTDADERERLRDGVDQWFLEHGVPQLADRYSPQDRLRYLVISLVVLVAFEVGAAPQLRSPLLPLLVVPPVVVALLAWARPFMWRMLGRGKRVWRSHWRRLVGLLGALAILTVVLRLSSWPPPWSDAWVDFFVILLGEFAAMAVFPQEVWRCNDEPLASLRRRLVLWTVGAVALFAFLTALDQGSAIRPRELLNDLTPWTAPTPLALPALVVMLLILVQANRVSLAAKSRPANNGESEAPRRVAICYPAVPLLILVLAAQTTILREARSLEWGRVGLPVACLVLLFVLSSAWLLLSSTASWRRRSVEVREWLVDRQPLLPVRPPRIRLATWDRMFEGAGHPLFLIPLLAASLIGYPVRVGGDLGVQVFGWSVVGGVAAAVMFAAYAALVWFFVWFGLDRVGVWVVREIRSDVSQIVQGVAGGLPILLVFAAFFALTAETWQVVVETDTAKFLILVGLLVALTLGVLVILATQQLRQAQEDLEDPTRPDDRMTEDEAWRADWKHLSDHALREGPSQNGHRTAVDRLFDCMPDTPQPLALKLEPRMRVNALLVIAVYQALVLVPVGVGALVLFWVVGRLAVPNHVAAQWIYGDNAGSPGVERLAQLPFWSEPWTRVPVVLAAFSVLYLTVSLLTDENQRKYFFSAAHAALRQRLAIRIAYRLRLSAPGDRGTGSR
jgi:hypothetical protein